MPSIPVCFRCGDPTLTRPRTIEVLIDQADAREDLDGRRIAAVPLCHFCARKVCVCYRCEHSRQSTPYEEPPGFCRLEPKGVPIRADDCCSAWSQDSPITDKELVEIFDPPEPTAGA